MRMSSRRHLSGPRPGGWTGSRRQPGGLLPNVFGNVLTNAVGHGDTDGPTSQASPSQHVDS